MVEGMAQGDLLKNLGLNQNLNHLGKFYFNSRESTVVGELLRKTDFYLQHCSAVNKRARTQAQTVYMFLLKRLHCICTLCFLCY